jgi:His/Glu/Gln/Arg/opine family amino acid ABC transporter permease subunit
MGPVYLRLMFTGLLFTLAISAGSLTIGAILGFILGTGRTSSILWLRAVITLYVEAIRSVPLLIFLFLVFYGLPVVTGLVIAPLTAAIVTQGIYVSAYMTEIVRAGIQAVPNGQWQASRALGLGYWRTITNTAQYRAWLRRTFTDDMLGQWLRTGACKGLPPPFQARCWGSEEVI